MNVPETSAAYSDMERMFGYGQPRARLWSIGLEEHCSERDLVKRIELRRTAGEYIDLDAFHRALYGYVPSSVSVWDVTLRIYERIFGLVTKLGGADAARSDVLVSEILPLPRPQHGIWPSIYHSWWPRGPEQYIAHALPMMARRLIDRVREFTPRVVLLHGKTEHRKWIRMLSIQQWEEVTLGERRNATALLARTRDTVWALTNNFVSNGYVRWDEAHVARLACAIREQLAAAK